MSRHAFHHTLPLALLLCAASAGAEPPSRLAAAIDARGSFALSGSVHPQAQARYDAGRVDGATLLRGSLELHPSPAQQADLDELLRQQQDSASPNYHAWLTPQQYGARFGLSAQDLNRIEAWLRAQGLSIDGVDSGGNHIRFSGSVARIEAAFQTELHRYHVDGELHFANATELALPAALSGMVLGVRGLDDFRLKPRLHRQQPEFTSGLSGNHFLSPGDIATIYDVKALYNAGTTGGNLKIAVVGQSAIFLRDVQAFRSAAGLPAKDPVLTLVPNTGSSVVKQSSGDEDESDLDVEWTGGVARDATIEFVYTGNASNTGVIDALNYVITNNVAPVISMSYGDCEANNSTVYKTVEGWLRQANTQGQTLLVSSGDTGAADCEMSTSTSATTGLAVDYPASSALATGLGGTEFNEGSGNYWQSNANQDVISSALSYIPEVAWNDTSATTTHTLTATGGGKSTLFTKPTWQIGVAGVPSDNVRFVPDVAMDSSNAHDPYLYCTSDANNNPSCVNGFRQANNNLTTAGGTSFAAPVFAGVVALVEQSVGATTGLGNINPRLYQLAGTSAFHDIIKGDNIVPCTTGTQDCTTGHFGYTTNAGYDPVTGLGSVDAAVLASSWVAGGSSSSSSSSSGGSSSSSSSSSSSGSSSSSSSSGSSGVSSSSSSSSSSSGSASSSSSSSSSSSGASGSGGGGGGGGGGAWAPLPMLLLSALAALRRRWRL